MKNTLNWIGCFESYCARQPKGYPTNKQAWNAMMCDLRRGIDLPCGVGTWDKAWENSHPGERVPDKCPPSWIPTGASYGTLQKKVGKFLQPIKPACRRPIKQETISFDDMHHDMLVARCSETGTDMIRAYGKLEAVVEMYKDGTLSALKAFDRITEIITGKGVTHA